MSAASFVDVRASAVLAEAVLAGEMDPPPIVPYDSIEAGNPAGGH